jgi:DNA adenine methylase
MKPILKWPGGKSREIATVYGMIPEHTRYLEPFFGGGAMFFHLQPEHAAINDTSRELMSFYALVRAQDRVLRDCLYGYARSFAAMLELCRSRVLQLLDVFEQVENRDAAAASLSALLEVWTPDILALIPACLRVDAAAFRKELERNVWDKLCRTAVNHKKKPFPPEDLSENLITGFASGYYMYFRQVYNNHHLGIKKLPAGEAAANFFFVRESCYGSMFRYNAHGEFNIPYGGMSYNRKNMDAKIANMFNRETKRVLRGTELCCLDFEAFLEKIQVNEGDFLFLDPPYDTEFSDYEGKAFTKLDQARLAVMLKKTKAKFVLIIKNTEFIYNLYNQNFTILSFDKQYTYNVRSRNDRGAEHLIITNLPV